MSHPMLRAGRAKRALVCALLAAWAVSGCAPHSARARRRAGPVPVRVAQARIADVPVTVRAVGNVQAFATVAVRPQVTGQLETVHFHEGQEVKKGDLLFTLDARPFQAALAQAKAALASDSVQAQNDAADVRRYAALVKKDYVTEQQYANARAGAAAMAASVTADAAKVKAARLNLAYCTIRSPISGRTGSLLVQPGNLVQAGGSQPLVVIVQLQPIYVSFAVPEEDLSEIRAHAGDGLPVSATPSQKSAPPSETGLALTDAKGKLTFIDNTVNAATGTIQLKAEFQNTSERLWPGEFVDTVLTVGERKGVVVVPSQAVQTGQAGPYVFVVKGDRTVAQRPVTPGLTDGQRTVIQKGIAAGETVVTDGQLRLTPGAKVSVVPSAKAAPP